MTIVEALTLLCAGLAAGTPGVLAAIGSRSNHAKLNELHLTLNSRLDDFFKLQAEALRTIAETNQKIGRADQKRDMDAIVVETVRLTPPVQGAP